MSRERSLHAGNWSKNLTSEEEEEGDLEGVLLGLPEDGADHHPLQSDLPNPLAEERGVTHHAHDVPLEQKRKHPSVRGTKDPVEREGGKGQERHIGIFTSVETGRTVGQLQEVPPFMGARIHIHPCMDAVLPPTLHRVDQPESAR